MSNAQKLSILVLAIIIAGGWYVVGSHSNALGGIVNGTRVSYTTTSGDMSTSTLSYVVPGTTLGTTTLVADIRDADEVSLMEVITASSSIAVNAGTRIQYSETSSCGANPTAATWYEYAPVSSTLSATTLQLASSTTYQFNQGATSSIPAFTTSLPSVKATCVRVQIFAVPGTPAPNFAVWAAIVSQRKGYNNAN